ncbi:hypothetical protein BH20ACI2_BH20ACI2_05210 [soil metagenome]
MNTLYYGDNFKILRDHFRDESADLVYPGGTLLIYYFE